MDRWTTAAVGVEAVGPILRFMEDHPAIDFGAPGPLVHFMERFEALDLLLDSIRRRPVYPTVNMLHRWLNGLRRAGDPAATAPFVEALRQAEAHPLIDAATRDYVRKVLTQHV